MMLSQKQTIAVFRALQLGDMLCIVPALRSLRAAAPHAHIVLIGLPWAAEFAQRFSNYVDEFVAFPGFPSWPERTADCEAFPGFLQKMQNRRFDLVIQMHGSGALSNPVVMLFGARQTAGFYPAGQYCPDPHSFLPWVDDEHEIRRFVRLMQHLGAPFLGEELEFSFAAESTNVALFPTVSYVCMHPGSRLASRRWHPERFAEVADRLAADGFRIVLTGTRDEAALTRAVAERMQSPAIDLCGKTNLDGLAALLAKSQLLVCNDTGVSHIAAALGIPSVVIACGSDVKRWAPLHRERHAVLAAEVACRPCMHEVCPIGHLCANEVTADMVYQEALKLLLLPRLMTGSTR